MEKKISSYRFGLLRGDGIGPEIVPATARIVDAAIDSVDGTPIEWMELPVGWDAIREGDVALPEDTIRGLRQCDGWLLGPIDFVAYPENERLKTNPSGMLRKTFDLYANIRPARAIAKVGRPELDVDIVIVRENTEGFYADRNMYDGAGDLSVTDDVRVCVGVFTRKAINRIAHVACRWAMQRRRHLTIVHKANVLPRTMGLWLEECRSVAEQYDLEVDDYHIDAMAAHLVRRPAEFDVLVMENLFGDILSDLAGELAGSLGLSPSLNAGSQHAMAQAAHGSAPDIAGTNAANPVGEILSAVMLLEWLSDRDNDEALYHTAGTIRSGVMATIREGIATKDMGGSATTSGFADAVIGRLGA